MKTCVLASGSGGNSTLVETENTKILIDLGKSCAYVVNKLTELEINPKEITGILVTHTHADHTAGLKVFLKKYKTKLYLTYKMYEELSKEFTIENYCIIEEDFYLDDIFVNIIKTSHDTNDSNGYIIECNKKSVVYITDTGYINRKNYIKLRNKNVYIMESNHDINMLMNGKYPYYLKQRILGDRGHLSNKDSSEYLTKFVGEDTNCIILAHLSKDNNTQEIALKTIRETFRENNKNINKIIIATQDEKTELIEV